MRPIYTVLAMAAAIALFASAAPVEAGGCAQERCKPAKPVCVCKTISKADFAACGGAWYASTSEGWRSPMFYQRKGCICTYKSNDWSYVGPATGRTYLWRIWVGH